MSDQTSATTDEQADIPSTESSATPPDASSSSDSLTQDETSTTDQAGDGELESQEPPEDEQADVDEISDKDENEAARERKVPDYAHVIVVPIANPETAPELLELAKGIVSRDGGRIIALAITLSDSDAEENREQLDMLNTIVNRFKPQGQRNNNDTGSTTQGEQTDDNEEPMDRTTIRSADDVKSPSITIEFVTRTANAIARGILDQARESGAELIIMGVKKSARGDVMLGSVAQSVMSAAPADVLIYRYSQSPRFSRVVVPVDGSPASRMAARIGIMVANSIKHCSVEAVNINTDARPNYQSIGRIEQALEGVPGRGIVKKTVYRGQNPAATLLARTDEDDLIIMGFTRRGDFEKWVRDDDKDMRRLLDEARGPLLLAVRSIEVVTPQQRFRRRVINWLRPTLTDVEQEQVMWDATDNAGINLDYVVLTLISALLASLGLLLDSAAVIIGAMLVAPLIAPLNAFGVGLSTARLDLTRRASVTTLVGTVIASLVGILTGLIVPLEIPTEEMMSRVSPSLLDAFVALASGVIAAYATARKDIPVALAGVAIAAALVPPICTFGLQLAFGNISWALGAMLLFLTNIVCIAVIATGTFNYLGLRPMNISPQSRRQYISLIIFVALIFPAVLAVVNVSQEAGESRNIEREVRSLLEPVETTNVEADGEDPISVTATIRTPYRLSSETVAFLQERMESDLDTDIELRIVIEEMLLSQESSASWQQNYEVVANPLLTLRDGELVPREDAETQTEAESTAEATLETTPLPESDE